LLHVDPETVKVAPWSALTIIDLVSLILAVPDPAQCDDIEQWNRDWLEPAQWLIEALGETAMPLVLWSEIATHIFAILPGGPTWLARFASRPFTWQTLKLQHVVGFLKDTRQLDGHTWKDVKEQIKGWQPDPGLIPAYTGPMGSASGLLVSRHDNDASAGGYEAGYGGVEVAPTAQVEDVTQASPPVNDASDCSADELAPTDDVPTEVAEAPEVPRFAMSCAEALALHKIITARYPELSPEFKDIGDNDVELYIEYEEGRWLTLRRADQWCNPAPATQRRIEKAVQLAQSRTSTGPGAGIDDERGPPGDPGDGEVIRDARGEAML
jgi:hypothetical protein